MFYDRVKIWLPNITSYLEEMKTCDQDPIWHGEGDVLTHTIMVLDEVEKLLIKEDDKEILRWTALLHDIGKPYVSTIEDGKIRSHGHSKKGYHIAMELLENVELDFNDKLQILNLIRYHGDPPWVMEDSDPYRKIIKLSMDCRLDLLYHISVCDFKGRIAPDTQEYMDKLNYFKELSIELDCFSKPFNFTSNISRYKYIVEETHHFSDDPFDDTKSKVTMVCGLPGSGKDFYINKAFDIPVISLDEIRGELKIKPTDEQGLVIQTAKERARKYMRKGQDFVWNATNVTKQMRSNLISLFNSYKSYISIVFINKPLATVLEQNKNRDIVVPEKVVLKLHKKMEYPSLNEAHEISIF